MHSKQRWPWLYGHTATDETLYVARVFKYEILYVARLFKDATSTERFLNI